MARVAAVALLLCVGTADAVGLRGALRNRFGAPRTAKSAGGGVVSERAAAALRELQGVEGDWTFVLEKQGVTVWKRGHDAAAEDTPFAVRATIEIPAVAAGDVAAILLTRDYDVIRKFNPTVVRGEDIEWRDGRRERTTYILTKPVWPLKPRDFVCDVRHEPQPDGSQLILNAPATHARAPAPRGTVRGELRGLHLCAPRGDGCQYTCVHEIDPGGAAPRPLVNWFALRKPLVYMTQLRDLARKMHPPPDA